MKNKLYVVSGAFLASLGLLACGGGGGNTPVTPVTEKGIKVELKNPSAEYCFGDKIYKDDLVVTMQYSDGSSKILSNDKYKAYELDIYKKPHDIEFPIPLEYYYGRSTKTINIRTTDNSSASYCEIKNIKKYDEFMYGSEGEIPVYYTNPTKFSFKNPLKPSGAQNVVYKSTKEQHFIVGETTGIVTTSQSFTSLGGSVISAYVDGVKVDEYILKKYEDDSLYVGIEITEDKEFQRKSTVKAADFDPRPTGDHKLSFPGIIEGNNITKIAADGFKDCVKIERLQFPGNLTTIGSGAFSGCTALNNNDRTLNIPYTVKHIGANAFLGTKLSRIWIEDPYNWHCSYQDEETNETKIIDVDPKYFLDKDMTAKILTREDLCDATYFKL